MIRLISVPVLFAVLLTTGVAVSFAQSCRPVIYFIKGAAQSDRLDNGMVSELYGLVKGPYQNAGASILRFPHKLTDSLHKQVLHDLKGGLFGTRSSDLVRSFAKTVHEDRYNPIVLVGHSWGGASAYQLTELFSRYSQSGTRRLVLVTLDPVSYRYSPFNPDAIGRVFHADESEPERVPHPAEKFLQLNYGDNGERLSEEEARKRIPWANVFATPKHLGCSNVTAQIGGWWGNHGDPDFTLEANTADRWPNWYKTDGQDTGHCDVIPMYYLVQDFVINEIDRTCGLRMPRGELSMQNGKETLVFPH